MCCLHAWAESFCSHGHRFTFLPGTVHILPSLPPWEKIAPPGCSQSSSCGSGQRPPRNPTLLTSLGWQSPPRALLFLSPALEFPLGVKHPEVVMACSFWPRLCTAHPWCLYADACDHTACVQATVLQSASPVVASSSQGGIWPTSGLSTAEPLKLAGCPRFPGWWLAASSLGPLPIWKRALEHCHPQARPSGHPIPEVAEKLAECSCCELVMESQAAT